MTAGPGNRDRTPGWIRLALLAFPRAFRRRFGGEMEVDLMRQAADASRSRVGIGLRVVRAGLMERIRPSWTGRDVSERERGGVGTMLGTILQETAFALRALRRRPGFTMVAVLTIALGIGANTAIFSVVDGVLLSPLPWPEADRLVRIGSVAESSDGVSRAEYGTLETISHPEMEAMTDLDAFSSVVALRSSRVALTGMGPAEMIQVSRVTRGVLETFGMAPVVGRDLRPEEATDPARRVTVVSHEAWTRRFGADPAIVGSTVTLDAERYEIVGVAPADASWPQPVEFWVPGGTVEGDCWWGCSLFHAVARLAPDASVGQAQQQLDALALSLAEASPATQTNRSFSMQSLHTDLVQDVEEALWTLLGAVGLVLLIACANVAHLLLARGTARHGEFAVRSALGASRGRVLWSVLTEGVVLGFAGALLGVVLAAGAIQVLPALSDGSIPRIDQIAIDPPVLGFTLLMTVLAIGVFGVVPGLRAVRGVQLAGSMREGGRSGTQRAGRRSLLLSVEVALSLILLVGAGLLMRNFVALTSADLGITDERITRFDLSLPDGPYADADRVLALGAGLRERLMALPGVEEVSISVGAPLSAYSIGGSVRFIDRPEPLPGESSGAAVRVATPGHFDIYGLEVVQGRFFDETDRRGEPTAYVVNQTFVDHYFEPGDDPIGEPVRMGLSFGYGREPGRIVGVVEDVRTVGVAWEVEPEIYAPWEQLLSSFFTVSIATRDDVIPVAWIQEVVADLDGDVPLFRLNRIEEAMASEVAPTRFYLSLLGAFALLAMILAAVGLYGVVSYSVGQRTREIGLRVAMGADRDGIVRMVLAQGLRPTLVGMALGLVGALAVVRVLDSVLQGVESTDLLTFVTVPIVLLVVAMTAIFIPARRAARVEPVEALRAE